MEFTFQEVQSSIKRKPKKTAPSFTWGLQNKVLCWAVLQSRIQKAPKYPEFLICIHTKSAELYRISDLSQGHLTDSYSQTFFYLLFFCQNNIRTTSPGTSPPVTKREKRISIINNPHRLNIHAHIHQWHITPSPVPPEELRGVSPLNAHHQLFNFKPLTRLIELFACTMKSNGEETAHKPSSHAACRPGGSWKKSKDVSTL